MKTRQINKQTRSTLITFAIAIIGFVLAKSLIHFGLIGSQMTGLMIPICFNIILAVSLNLTVGILGELSLGHAGFMCVGAFASSTFSVVMRDSFSSTGLRFALAMLIGALTAGFFGLIIGIPVLRLRGDYLAIVTLAFGEIIKNFVNNIYFVSDKGGYKFALGTAPEVDTQSLNKIIYGPSGVGGVPNDSTFNIAFIMVLLTLFVIINLVNSRSGRAIKAIRDNRIAAQSVGVSISKYKLLALVVSAMFAGIAGVLYTHNISVLKATTQNFGYSMSIMILVFVVLGGIGSIRGSMIAAVLLTILPEWLRFLANMRMLIYALVLIALMIFNNSPVIEGYREKLVAFLRKIFIKNKQVQEGGGLL